MCFCSLGIVNLKLLCGAGCHSVFSHQFKLEAREMGQTCGFLYFFIIKRSSAEFKHSYNALSIRSLLECPLTQPPNETAKHSHNLPMRQPDNARKVVFVHGRLPQFYLTQIQRICGGGNKVDFWTPSQNCAKFQ